MREGALQLRLSRPFAENLLTRRQAGESPLLAVELLDGHLRNAVHPRLVEFPDFVGELRRRGVSLRQREDVAFRFLDATLALLVRLLAS